MQPKPFSTADVHAPGANTAAQINYAAVADRRHALSGVAWSYSGAPTGGQLTIEDGSGSVVFRVDISAAGPGVIYFTPPKHGGQNTALIVTLAAGGAGVSGKVAVLAHWKE
jgi:hypothetical protein